MRTKGGFKHTRLFLKDSILFDIPSDAFNASRVQHWRDEVLALTESLDSWFLISIPDKNLGITQEAVDRLVETYRTFSQQSCSGVAILTSTVSSKILTNCFSLEGLEHFILMDESIENLFERVEKRLGDPTILNDAAQ